MPEPNAAHQKSPAGYFIWFLVPVVIALVYGMVVIDVMARARSSFQHAQIYDQWDQDPESKKQFFERKFFRQKAVLDQRREQGRISQDEYAVDVERLNFQRDKAVNDLSIKYAFQFYHDTYALFSPPETKLIRQARLLAPAAKQRWRETLAARGIPFQEYMLGLEAGEDTGHLMVYSTRKQSEADQCLKRLQSSNIQVILYNAPAQGRPKHEGIKVMVPPEQFWQAHEMIKRNLRF